MDRSEFDVSGHQLGYTNGEGCELLVDVHEEGVGAPAAHLSDLDVAAVVQMHGHGSASSERVAADVTFVIAKLV